MKILFVSEYFYPHTAGGEIWSMELCVALAARGHEVTVITTRERGATSEVLDGVRILRPVTAKSVGARILRFVQAKLLLSQIDQYLRTHAPDVIHVMAYTLNVEVSKMARAKNIPCVTSVHSYFGEDWKYLSPLPALLTYLERRTILNDRSAVMHVPSQYLKDRLQKIGKETVIIHNWISDLPQTSSPRKALLFVGSLERIKNPVACIKVAKRLNLPLEVIGKGSLRKTMLDEAKSVGVRLQIHDGATRRQTLKRIGTAALLLVPSITESFSLVALEAVAQGTPVSGTAVGIMPEMTGVVPFPPERVPPRIPRTTQLAIRKKFSKARAITSFEKLYTKLKRNV